MKKLRFLIFALALAALSCGEFSKCLATPNKTVELEVKVASDKRAGIKTEKIDGNDVQRGLVVVKSDSTEKKYKFSVDIKVRHKNKSVAKKSLVSFGQSFKKKVPKGSKLFIKVVATNDANDQDKKSKRWKKNLPSKKTFEVKFDERVDPLLKDKTGT
jgi:hypothetical protein